jgi:hypothetical protein
VTTPFGSQTADAYSVALQPDGRIVAAGEGGPIESTTFELARYNPDGSLDSSFGTDGLVTSAVSSIRFGSAAFRGRPRECRSQ